MMESQRPDTLDPPNNIIRGGTTSHAAGIRQSTPASGQPIRSEDSWIELSSQPSSSSLSSAATTDDIVTTGLRIQQQRRRRGPRHILPRDIDISYPHRSSSLTESSQDENEELESEPDQILSSSNEDLPGRPDIPRLPDLQPPSDETLSSDEDDASTALGFNPQPNAFSHPPASQRNTVSRPSSVLHANRPNSRRNSRSSAPPIRRPRNLQQRQQQHSPYNMIAPSHHADHDAALRASLSTLLSCAAAARRLPKNDSPPTETSTNNQSEPSTFRLVPGSMAAETESEAVRPPAQQGRVPQAPPILQKRSPSPISSASKARRRASFSKDRSTNPPKSRRTTAADSTVVSPTVMTWVISAGVVVLFSAISFSAGYVLGREIGRLESGQGMYGPGITDPGTSGCGKEAVKGGLRRFRWVGGGMGSGINA